MNAKVKWVQGLQFAGESGTKHEIIMDADAEFGGKNQGMRPMELLLVAIGGCSGMDVASVLLKKKQQLDGLEINVTGTKAENHPQKFTDIELEFIITGKDIAEQAVKKAVESSMDKYCSVKATLEGVAKITYRYTIVNT